MRSKLWIALLFFSVQFIVAQKLTVTKIEPPNWWTGMKWNKIQLMIYGENLSNISAQFNDKKISINKIHKIDNPSYAFIDITIPINLESGNYTLTLSKGKEKIVIDYAILKREKGIRHQGFSSDDVLYLVMPDRFANGDITNDKIHDYYDWMDTIKYQGRAGGDIQGMIDKLDYMKDLGITTVWPTPLVENNTFRSYHGYSATDFYKIDPRLGTNQLYKSFVEEAHKRGIKIILDHVANHFSDNHPWMKNLPMKSWINGTKENHLNANHHKMIFTDVHSDSSTIKHVEQGWFVNDMVDINQENPFVQNYIIQNTIWWVEYSGLDGIREDTHPYNNQKFISRWAKTILEEFPSLNIVGEVWTGESDLLAAFQKNTFLKKNFNTYLPSVTDFALRDVLVGLVSNQNNLYKIFNVISKDYLFTDPNQLLTFIDNHDVGRVMFYANKNMDKTKLAYTILLTTRGIPCLFYGSEIGLVGTPDHGQLRIPFPGGFPEHERNAFASNLRTEYENEIFTFLQKLISIRKNYEALSEGKLIHFPPVNDVYYYFRIYKDQKIFIVINNRDEQVVDFSMIKHLIGEKRELLNLVSNEKVIIADNYRMVVPNMKAEIFLIK
ncbi:MAG: alpha-amlyase [Ignavibacteria bacterium]|nr:alpha-amlyase [Ignavibacteria bacterium]